MKRSGRINRFTISNMGVEMGAKNSVFYVDNITKKYLNSIGISSSNYDSIYPDDNASYIREITYDLVDIAPMIACPHAVDNVKSVSDIKGLKIPSLGRNRQLVLNFYILFCTH